MSTSINSQSGNLEQSGSGKLAKPLTYDFALLGISTREARVDAIRDAANRRAGRIHSASEMADGDRQDLLSELAVSTYRVLDPRRRSKLMERVQLCLISDLDYERQQNSHEPLMAESEPFVVAELVEVEANHEAQMLQAKREFVRFLLDERRNGPGNRVGKVLLSVVVATATVIGSVAAAILL